MKTLALLGMQWGDEGKGKVIDHLAAQYDITVRFQGGGNAGHTVVVDGRKHVLHHIPSSILHEGKTALIADGTVLDVDTLFEEIGELRKAGIEVTGRLLIGFGTHIVMPYHKELDAASEESGGQKIGTTKRGIGPCYADRKARLGIRYMDLFDGKALSERLSKSLAEKNCLFKHLYGKPAVDHAAMLKICEAWASKIKGFGVDTHSFLIKAISESRTVLFEGAQGAMLDTDWGTYPFVTSSTTTASAIPQGCGIPMKSVDHVMGVVKAYSTRVGSGPFPTEDTGEIGELLRKRGGEYGATTGRPRRCGWLDAVAGKYAVTVNGADSLAITKLDVLSGIGDLKVCVSYGFDGCFPDPRNPREPKPSYKTFKGWKKDISGAEKVSDLPAECRTYVDAIEGLFGARVSLISVGPDRRQVFEKG